MSETSVSRIASKFVGAWKLVTVGNRRRLRDRMGEAPRGLLIYDASGYMSVQTFDSDRPNFASNDVEAHTLEELRAAFNGYTAYFGAYEVDPRRGIVIHHVQGSLFPNNVGGDQIRYFKFSGDRLILMPAVVADGKLLPNSPGSRRLIWERVTPATGVTR